MDNGSISTLPAGLWLGGKRYRVGALRPAKGADEAFLAEEGAAQPPVEKTTSAWPSPAA